MEKKELRLDTKTIKEYAVIMCAIWVIVTVVPSAVYVFEFGFDGILEFFFEPQMLGRVLIYGVTTIVLVLFYCYQRKNNVLESGNYGFQVKGNTYAYTQVTKLVARHRGNRDTSYHLYVGDEIVFKFSHYYENKDEFVEYLQRNGVQIIL